MLGRGETRPFPCVPSVQCSSATSQWGFQGSPAHMAATCVQDLVPTTWLPRQHRETLRPSRLIRESPGKKWQCPII